MLRLDKGDSRDMEIGNEIQRLTLSTNVKGFSWNRRPQWPP